MDTGQGRGLGPDGLRRAATGPEGEMGRAFGLGPDRQDRVCFFIFPKLIFNAQTIPERYSNCFKAPKILGKFQKFQENSQRHFGSRAIQIKYLELLKKDFRAF
jgi:hypothetical protein